MVNFLLQETAAFGTKLLFGLSAFAHGVDLTSPSQRIFFANHTSNADFPVLWAALPAEQRKKTRPVAARDYWQTGGVKELIASHLFRAIFVDRKPRKDAPFDPLREVRDALEQGDSIIIFPEGTRSYDGSIQEFRSGLFHLARHFPNAQCVPVYLHNLNRILPKGEVLVVPLISRVFFGSPILIQEGETKPSFLSRAEAALRALQQLSRPQRAGRARPKSSPDATEVTE